MEEKKSEHLEDLNRQQSIENGNEPANPVQNRYDFRHGLTKRETMAMHILTAYIAKGDNCYSAVSSAVSCADALLDELRKHKAK